MTHPRKNKFAHHRRPEGGYQFERWARDDRERLLATCAKAGRASIHLQGAAPVNARLVAAKAAKRDAWFAQTPQDAPQQPTAAQDAT